MGPSSRCPTVANYRAWGDPNAKPNTVYAVDSDCVDYTHTHTRTRTHTRRQHSFYCCLVVVAPLVVTWSATPFSTADSSTYWGFASVDPPPATRAT